MNPDNLLSNVLANDSPQAQSEVHCPLPEMSEVDTLTSDLCDRLEEAGCPLAAEVQKRFRFETLLSTFRPNS